MIITRKDLDRYPILHEWARVRMLWLAEFKPMLIKKWHLEDPNLLFDHLNKFVEQAMRTYLNLEEKGVSAREAMEIVLDILAPMEVTETVPKKYQIPEEAADAMLAIMREEVHRIVHHSPF